AAFFGGVALCISLNYSWLLLGLLISLTYTRSGVWREWAWAIIGFLLPGMLKMVICWVFFEGFDWFHQWMATLTLVPKELSFHWGYIPLLVLFFWGLTGFLGSYIDSSIKGRNTRTVWLIMMLSYLLCGIFESEYSFSNISLWILPIVSILIGFCLLSRRVRWWQKVLFWLVLSAVSISLVGLVFN
ncbi:MAG: hypothetical protein HRT74_03130, partial [Flavobacteriales bacterium]|nr:hypothetical protein [Flavobacteriales bacterium]